MPTPDIWIYVLPALYSGILGAQAVADPGKALTIGPADYEVIGGLGGILKANNTGEQGTGEATFGFVDGYKFFNLQPKFNLFVTQRGDVVAGVGVHDEIVFQSLNLRADGSAPLFFAWSGGPAYYWHGPLPGGNYGHPFQFQMTDEVGFYFGRSMRVSVAFNHYSDGGFTDVNPNGNAFTLNLGYRF